MAPTLGCRTSREKEGFKNAIEESELYTPSIVLAENSRVFARKKVPRDRGHGALNFITERSLILSLDEANDAEAGELAEREGLSLIDGIAYSYAKEGKRLQTGDRHLKGRPHVDFLGS
ncbi:MAG: PIN domain-containing protein [Candidatus Bathyarchaeia archaeon]